MSFFGSGTPSGFSFGSGDGQNQQQQQVRFGSPAPTQGGFSFGTPTQSNAPPATGLFGTTPNVQTPNTGFSFGGGGAATPSTAPTAGNTALSGGGFTFGTPNTTTTPKSTFGTGFVAPNVTANTAASPMSSIFSGTATPGGVAAVPTAQTTQNTGFGFGAAASSSPASATSSPFGTGFGAKPTSTISFGTPGTGFTFGQSAAAAVTTTSSLFGSTPTASTFGTQQTNLVSTTTAASVPGFGGTSGTNTGFNFGGTAATTPNKGLSFGITPAAPAAAPITLTSQTTGGLQLGSVPNTTAAAAPQSNLFGLSASGGASTGVKLGGVGLSSSTTAPSSTTTGGLTFGIAKTTPLATVTTTPTLFGLGTSTSTLPTTAPASIATATTAGFSFGVGASKPTTAATTSELTITPVPPSVISTTSTAQATLSLGSSAIPTTRVASTTTAAATTLASVAAPPATINFRKLEEDINKWTVELEEQERVFIAQATQVNAWDRILISNGEKITRLNDALESVKLDQEHLDQEIDFIHSQQNELEELLAPLEKSVETLPTLSIHQHADLEREQTFQMAENIDSQLRLMSRDLKDVIEHLNSTTGPQDNNDPIQQIGKILNSHMDSLQWIDQNTNVLRKKVDEVARVYEICRQDQEKGLHLPYM